MNDLLRDGFGHHLWATRELFAFCRPLSDEQRAATAPGTYGSIHATLQHLVESDAWYLSLLTGQQPAWANFEEDVPRPFEEVEGGDRPRNRASLAGRNRPDHAGDRAAGPGRVGVRLVHRPRDALASLRTRTPRRGTIGPWRSPR